MDKKDVIKKITDEVINKIEMEMDEVVEKSHPDTGINLVIVPEFFLNLQSALRIINQEAGSNKLLFALKTSGEDLNLPGESIDISNKRGQNILASKIVEINEVYCVSPRIKTLKALTELDDTNFTEWLLIRSLLVETKVNILLNYSFSINNSLQERMKDLFKEVSKLGIKVRPINLKGTQSPEEDLLSDKNLITEEDINQLWEQGQGKLEVNNSIITPLAIDRARELGLKVKY